MVKNRLNLNFALSTNAERVEFVEKYLELPQWKINPLTAEELETIGNYILYGKDENGKNFVQKKEVQIATRYGTWDRKEEESYEAMLENPAFNENTIHPIDAPAAPKVRREAFSREEAAQNPQMLALLEPLLKKIDDLDLLLNCYDLRHGKRKKPIRPELLEKFTDEQIAAAHEAAAHLNQYQYLKRRHLLVEYRSEQYSIRDNFVDPIISLQNNRPPQEYRSLEFNAEVPVFPFGLKDDSYVSGLLFRPFKEIHSAIYIEEELQKISKFFWAKNEERKNSSTFPCFDFANPEHLAELYINLADITWEGIEKKHNTVLYDTLKFYEEQAHLEDFQVELLKMKVEKRKNQEIADTINEKFGKTYTANYISTIFRQKLMTKIAAAAEQHFKIFDNIYFEENFKKCSCCGRWCLIDSSNFVKKAVSADGFSSKCKLCDKVDRQKRKLKEKKNDNIKNI